MEELKIREFNLRSISPSCSWVVVGPPNSGKSTFIHNLLYANRDRYASGYCFCGEVDGYKKYGRIFGKLFTQWQYTTQHHRDLRRRQAECKAMKKCDSSSIVVIDDCIRKGDDTSVIREAFERGSQHDNTLFLYSVQDFTGIEKATRSSPSYVALFNFASPDRLEMAYKNFGSMFANKEQFVSVLKQCTGEYRCMIIDIKNLVKSNKLEDCVYYYQTFKMDKGRRSTWRIGCDEFVAWGDRRYNGGYSEVMM